MRPRALIKGSNVEVRFCGRSEAARGGMKVLSAGTSAASSAPVALPRARRARSTSSPRPASHVSTSSLMGGSLPLRFSWLMRRRPSMAASGVLTAACTTGMSARGNRNRVRRMAIQRTRLRRSYIAADTSARVDPVLRASTER
jgi:sulfur relay (sulfurtransferase) complex TusBCD TusD component (DsrE family)